MDRKRAATVALLFGLLCVGTVGLTVVGLADSGETDVGGEAAPEFNVTVLDVAPTVEGDTLTVTADIANEGEATGEETVELVVEGIGSDQTAEPVEIGAGQSTTVELTVDTEIGDALDSPYTATVTAGESELTEDAVVELPTVGGQPPQDLTGNGLYADVGGTGGLEMADVQLLFDNLDELGDHAWAFDFAGVNDQDVTIFDVQALFNEVQLELPIFTVELTDVPEEVEAGETIMVDYRVENVGGDVGTQDIVFDVDGEQRDSNDGVELGAGDDITDSFTYVTDEDDVPAVSVSVASNEDVQTESVSVTPAAEPNFEIVEFDAPEEVEAGEEIAVEYTVENTGDLTGTQDIVLEVDTDDGSGFQVEDSNESVELEPGDDMSETFTYVTDGDDPPAVTVRVSSDDDVSEEATVEVEPFELVATLSEETATVGETVTVDFNVSAIEDELDIGAYGVTIGFDTDILEFQSIGGGEFGDPDDQNVEDGELSALETGQDETTPFTMVEIQFEVIDEGVSPLEFVPGENNEINAPPEEPGVPAEEYVVRFVNGSAGTTTADS